MVQASTRAGAPRLLKNPRLSAAVFRLPEDRLPDAPILEDEAREARVEADPETAAYGRGWTEGEAAAKAELLPRVEAAAGDLARAAAALESARGELLARAEQELVELAVAIARRVIGAEIEGGREVAEALAGRAITRLRGSGAVRLLVHPSEMERIRRHLAADGSETSGIQIEVEGSPLVAPGGVVARTTARTVDARVEAQLEAIASELGLAAVDLAAAEALVGAAELADSPHEMATEATA